MCFTACGCCPFFGSSRVDDSTTIRIGESARNMTLSKRIGAVVGIMTDSDAFWRGRFLKRGIPMSLMVLGLLTQTVFLMIQWDLSDKIDGWNYQYRIIPLYWVYFVWIVTALQDAYVMHKEDTAGGGTMYIAAALGGIMAGGTCLIAVGLEQNEHFWIRIGIYMTFGTLSLTMFVYLLFQHDTFVAKWLSDWAKWPSGISLASLGSDRDALQAITNGQGVRIDDDAPDHTIVTAGGSNNNNKKSSKKSSNKTGGKTGDGTTAATGR